MIKPQEARRIQTSPLHPNTVEKHIKLESEKGHRYVDLRLDLKTVDAMRREGWSVNATGYDGIYRIDWI